jgi:hypothetical protein
MILTMIVSGHARDSKCQEYAVFNWMRGVEIFFALNVIIGIAGFYTIKKFHERPYLVFKKRHAAENRIIFYYVFTSLEMKNKLVFFF